MTIESDLNRIAIALEAIAASMSAPKVAHVTPVAAPTPVVQVAPVVAPVVAPLAPAAVEVPVMAPPAPAMPAAPFPMAAAPVPTPVAPVAAPVAVVAPAPAVASPSSTVFASKQEMTDFVVSSYRALGAEKGAQIQGVLTAMGFANINDVPPEQWGALKAGIDALKG